MNFLSFAQYYKNEKDFLNNEGKKFAGRYPKIARRLDLSDNGSSDPHISRLMDAFAFLTAKLQKQVDDQFPIFAKSLINTIYPNLLKQVPARGLLKINPDEMQIEKLKNGFTVPKGTDFIASDNEDRECIFKTFTDHSILPIKISDIKIVSKSKYNMLSNTFKSNRFIKITVQPITGELEDIKIDRIDFFINKQHSVDPILISILNSREIAINYRTEVSTILKPDSISLSNGFLNMIDESKNIDNFDILKDALTFEEKNQFITIENIDFTGAKDHADILIGIDDDFDIKLLNKDLFAINVFPVINIFKRISDPIRFDNTNYKYLLFADQMNEENTEIYTIDKIYKVADGTDEDSVIPSYFSFDHFKKDDAVFWHQEYETNFQYGGTDCHISIIDGNFNSNKEYSDIVYGNLVCTNRRLPESLKAETILEPQIELPVEESYFFQKPKGPTYVEEKGHILWQIISMLSCIHIGDMGKDFICEISEILASFFNVDHFNESIKDITIEDSIMPKNNCFIKGMKMKIYMGEIKADGWFLFVVSLFNFLATRSAFNSFIEMDVYLDDKLVYEFQPKCSRYNIKDL